MGYYYGGWLTQSSEPGYDTPTAIDTLLTYDMVANRFRNQSGPDTTRRAEGALLYIPAGDGGMLIYMGGIQVQNGTRTAQPMTEILVHDIANARWYKQKTSGASVPKARRRFCAGVVWTADRSSYNIYLFGGASIDDGIGYGDVWILSLPSFTWIKYFPTADDDAGELPHHSASCNIYGNSQMLIMGGHFPSSTECDVPSIYGQHGLDLSCANPLGAKWAAFNATRTTYAVPTDITKVIGGDASGNATATQPEKGWDTGDLAVVFKRNYTPPPRQPTRHIPTAMPTTPAISAPAESSNSAHAAVLGSAIGVVGALILVTSIATCIVLRRRRRRRHARLNTQPTPPPYHAMSRASSPSPVLAVSPLSPSKTFKPLPPLPPSSPPPDLAAPTWRPYAPSSSPPPLAPPTPSSRRSRATDTESMVVYAPLLDVAPMDAAERPWLRDYGVGSAGGGGGRLVCELEGIEGEREVREKRGVHVGEGRGGGGWL
jgi:hypothetical protein